MAKNSNFSLTTIKNELRDVPLDPLGHAQRSAIADPQVAFEKAGIHALVRIGEVQQCIKPEAKRYLGMMEKGAGERQHTYTAAI